MAAIMDSVHATRIWMSVNKLGSLTNSSLKLSSPSKLVSLSLLPFSTQLCVFTLQRGMNYSQTTQNTSLTVGVVGLTLEISLVGFLDITLPGFLVLRVGLIDFLV